MSKVLTAAPAVEAAPAVTATPDTSNDALLARIAVLEGLLKAAVPAGPTAPDFTEMKADAEKQGFKVAEHQPTQKGASVSLRIDY